MLAPGDTDEGRLERERAAYDDDDVWEHSQAWQARAIHVFRCPNTLRHERIFDDVLARYAANGRALDIGCGAGEQSRRLHALGARYVLGIDSSEKLLAQAMARDPIGAGEGGRRIEFRRGDVAEPIAGTYDLICGRSVLHHIGYAAIVRRLFDTNLSSGGALVFMEPLGSNLISWLFKVLVRSAHTPDERPFSRRDLQWFRSNFADVVVHPYNYLSYPAGIVSSLVCRRPDNLALRACDRVDTWLARHLRVLEPRFRQAIIVIRKPGTVAG